MRSRTRLRRRRRSREPRPTAGPSRCRPRARGQLPERRFRRSPSAARAKLCARSSAQRERRIDDDRQLGGENAQARGDGAIRDQTRDEEGDRRDLHRRIQHEREAVQANRTERIERKGPVDVRDRRRAQPSERARLEYEAGEHRQGHEDIRGDPARVCEQPERRVVRHRRPPTKIVSPAIVASTAATSARVASFVPARKSDFASTSASTASSAKAVTRRRSLSAHQLMRGSIKWCRCSPPRVQRRRSLPDVASPPRSGASVTTPSAVSTPTGR